MSIKADIVVIGAGPCDLFQVFELGFLGISAHAIDSLPQIGGQCTTLYPEKPIYDIPALLVIGAHELVDRLAEQIKPFAPAKSPATWGAMSERHTDRTFRLATSTGTEFIARSVVIAGGSEHSCRVH